MTTDAGTRITAEQVRLLLSDPKIFPDLDTDDTELVLDSLSLVWFLHLLELWHGVVLDPDDEHLTGVTSVNRITARLAKGGGDA